MSKVKCGCGNMAVWLYMPGFSGGSSPYFCDDCVTSADNVGCSCNWQHMDNNAYDPPLDKPETPDGIEGKDWRWVEVEGDLYTPKITKKDKIWQYLDEKGRPYPCVEYFYDEDGFDDRDDE